MDHSRFEIITGKYPRLRMALIGDFCLDRYLEIDPNKKEVSIETGLPVYNVVRMRAQPGAAGTILNNLVALGVGTVYAVGFCGADGEGFELRRALQTQPGVRLDHFFTTDQRCTFTYCKPLVLKPSEPPVELNRLDTKNWSPTPQALQERIIDAVLRLAPQVDAMILLDQVTVAETGVITTNLLKAIHDLSQSRLELPIIADSRRGLRGYPPVVFKMNAPELAALTGTKQMLDLEEVKTTTATLARQHGRHVFVTLSERGIVGATPDGEVKHVASFPVRGEIDIVGAGDAVTANLIAALAGEATVRESLELANAAASIVIHQLGTTGTASVSNIRSLLLGERA